MAKRVLEIIANARSRGCELRVPDLSIIAEGVSLPVRYLFNPRTGGRFDLTGFDDDDTLSKPLIAHAERRLGVKLS